MASEASVSGWTTSSHRRVSCATAAACVAHPGVAWTLPLPASFALAATAMSTTRSQTSGSKPEGHGGRGASRGTGRKASKARPACPPAATRKGSSAAAASKRDGRASGPSRLAPSYGRRETRCHAKTATRKVSRCCLTSSCRRRCFRRSAPRKTSTGMLVSLKNTQMNEKKRHFEEEDVLSALVATRHGVSGRP